MDIQIDNSTVTYSQSILNSLFLFYQQYIYIPAKLLARIFVHSVLLAGDNHVTVSWLGDFKFPSWLDHQEQTFNGALYLEFHRVLLCCCRIYPIIDYLSGIDQIYCIEV